jgi:hypothetical protein
VLGRGAETMPSHKNKRYWVIEITKGFGARNTFDLFAILKQIGDAKAIPILGGTLGRYRHQHPALDAGGARRLGRC